MSRPSTTDFAAALYQAASALEIQQPLGEFLNQLTLACATPEALHEWIDRCQPQLARLGQAYQEEAARAAQQLPARVVSAQPLDANRQQALRQALSRRFGRSVNCSFQVDPSLLGGVITYVDGQVIDGSLRQQLNALRRQMAEAPAPEDGKETNK